MIDTRRPSYFSKQGPIALFFKGTFIPCLIHVPGHRFAAVKGIGVFCLGEDTHSAETVASLVRDAAGIAAATESFGGPLPMTEDLTDFITHWEAESYLRKKF